MARIKRSWDKQDDESRKAYSYFLIYVDMGVQRSAIAVAEQTGMSRDTVTGLQSRYRWIPRAKAYDDHLLTIERNAVEKHTEHLAIIRVKKRNDYLLREESTANKMLDKIDEMLDFPLHEQVIDRIVEVNGEQVATQIRIMPTKWSLKDMAVMVKIAADRMRLALDMETSKQTMNVNQMTSQERIAKAQGSLQHLRETVDDLVDEMMVEDPTRNREEVKERILSDLPNWVSRDWTVPVEQLIDNSQNTILDMTGDDHTS